MSTKGTKRSQASIDRQRATMKAKREAREKAKKELNADAEIDLKGAIAELKYARGMITKQIRAGTAEYPDAVGRRVLNALELLGVK